MPGKYYEDLEVGAHFKHSQGRTITEMDNVMFSALTMNPQPLFHGDTIYAETEVLEKRESRSKPDRGIVRLKQTGRNQDGVIVVELERTVLFLKRPTT